MQTSSALECSSLVLTWVSLPVCCQVIELHQFLNDCFCLPARDALGDTGLQVVLQDNRFELLNRLAYRIGLTENIDTVLILFDHFTYSLEVSLNIIQAFEDLLPFSAHG